MRRATIAIRSAPGMLGAEALVPVAAIARGAALRVRAEGSPAGAIPVEEVR